jgi:cobaltochelatase CobS
MTRKISNAERGLLRKAITSAPGWRDYRAERGGITSADLGAEDCFAACAALGIDAEAVLAGATATTATATEAFNHVMAEEAAPEAPEIELEAAPVTGEHASAEEALRALARAMGGAVSVNPDDVRRIVAEAIQPLRERVENISVPLPRVVTVDGAGNEIGELPATRHPKAETLLRALSARMANGRAPNVWIAGPAGSGKTFACHQAAEALGVAWGFHGAMTMAHELIGFVDAGGTYHETVFVRLYRNGGLCLLDECDAGSSEALLALNAALANGEISLPNGEIIKRHPDFYCIAAANTYGHGGTAEYVGRAKIDAAFLDRFAVRIDWPYDDTLEAAICGNAKWAKRVQSARKAAADLGIKALITPRASEAGAALLAAGMPEDEVAALTYLAGMSDEQKSAIEGARK